MTSVSFTSPTLVWSIDKFLSEYQQLVWVGEGRVVIGTEAEWYLLNLGVQQINRVWQAAEVPPSIKPGEALANTGLIPDESARQIINEYLQSGEKTEGVDTDTVRITSCEIEMSPPSSLFTGADLVGQAGTIWSLAHFASSFARLSERPNAQYFKNEDHSLDVVPRAWTLWIDEEMVGLFITDEKPFVVFWEEEKAWFVLVQRWDCGLDVFRVDHKETAAS